MTRPILAALTAVILTACGSPDAPAPIQNATNTIETNQQPIIEYHPLIDSVQQVLIPSDTTQFYALYMPSSSDTLGIPHTIIVFCDPHGAGQLPIDKYRKLADKFGIALAGSNNSRNGLDAAQCVNYVNNIITDLHTRLHYETANICLAGFSGGSKVALQTTTTNSNINNVIYAGATIPFQANHPVRLLGFTGTSDMNYSDLLTFASSLPQGSGTLVEFDGKHEWPSATVYQKAFYWLAFRQIKDTQNVHLSFLLRDYKSIIEAEVAAAMRQNNTVEAYQKYTEAITFTNGLADVWTWQKKATELASTELYKKQMAQKADMLKSETNQKQVLMAAFQNQDVPWWNNTIAHLKSGSSPTDKRLLGFISLGCYSYTSQCMARGDMANAEHFAAIYELADPDNTDQLYFHAVIAGKKGDNATALKYLQRAVNEGFTDWQKADTEPALATVRGQGSFSRLRSSSGRSSR